METDKLSLDEMIDLGGKVTNWEGSLEEDRCYGSINDIQFYLEQGFFFPHIEVYTGDRWGYTGDCNILGKYTGRNKRFAGFFKGVKDTIKDNERRKKLEHHENDMQKARQFLRN